jgi:hypothetical protein
MHGNIDRRFWSKVDIRSSDECWEWLAGLHGLNPRNRYGAFWGGERMVKAHRFSYESYYGSIPNNKLILHKCDNKLCVNPKHLYVGTEADNISDREKRNPVSRELSGVTHTKLYEYEIYDIRNLRGKMLQSRVASIYNVSKNVIYRIWKNDEFLCKEGYYV